MFFLQSADLQLHLLFLCLLENILLRTLFHIAHYFVHIDHTLLFEELSAGHIVLVVDSSIAALAAEAFVEEDMLVAVVEQYIVRIVLAEEDIALEVLFVGHIALVVLVAQILFAENLIVVLESLLMFPYLQ